MTLQSRQVIFLQTNAISHLQPLDDSIIKNARHHYKRFLVHSFWRKLSARTEVCKSIFWMADTWLLWLGSVRRLRQFSAALAIVASPNPVWPPLH